jgi:hypothetical protein
MKLDGQEVKLRAEMRSYRGLKLKLYLMSSPSLGGFGEYKYKPITLDEASKLLQERKFISAVRYQWDADMLRDMLGVYVPINRGAVELEVGDAIVVVELPEIEPSGQQVSRRPRCIGLLERTS